MLNTKRTCVLIDDDEDDQLIFQTVLNIHFPAYQLNAYSSFEGAKSFILDHSKSIDAIFIDLNMPKSNGIDCLNFLREQSDFENKKIVIYSTSNNPDDAKKCLKNGATDFMTKPSRVNEWVNVLSKYLEG